MTPVKNGGTKCSVRVFALSDFGLDHLCGSPIGSSGKVCISPSEDCDVKSHAKLSPVLDKILKSGPSSDAKLLLVCAPNQDNVAFVAPMLDLSILRPAQLQEWLSQQKTAVEWNLLCTMVASGRSLPSGT
jgi:hypothetical protein